MHYATFKVDSKPGLALDIKFDNEGWLNFAEYWEFGTDFEKKELKEYTVTIPNPDAKQSITLWFRGINSKGKTKHYLDNFLMGGNLVVI